MSSYAIITITININLHRRTRGS